MILELTNWGSSVVEWSSMVGNCGIVDWGNMGSI
jgi:hypothetical protein